MFQKLFKILLVTFVGLVGPFIAIALAAIVGYLLVALPSILLWSGAVPSFGFVLFTSPFLGLFLVLWLRAYVRNEKKLIQQVGPHLALWHNREISWLPGFTTPLTGVVMEGWDHSGPFLSSICHSLGLPQSVVEEASKGLLVFASLWWSKTIYSVAFVVDIPLYYLFTGWQICVYLCALKAGVRMWKSALYIWLGFLLTLCFLPAPAIWDTTGVIIHLIISLSDREAGEWVLLKWARLRLQVLMTDTIIMVEGFNTEVKRHYSVKLGGERRSALATFRQVTIRSVRFIDSMKLPEFVRRRLTWKDGVNDVEHSRALLEWLGWPVNVEITEPDMSDPVTQSWRDWLICGSDFRTGISQLQVHYDKNLDHLRAMALEYKRTETYQSIGAELTSTSRYFQNRKPEGLPDVQDDVWEVLGTIFRNSNLTPFNYIIKMWEKKYALGFWMKTPGRKSKMKRSAFISTIGFSNFKKLWARTFYYASQIAPVAHVSVKGEALPPKKWQNGLVRSIIGSPITHYIMSTVFNYGPNHHFDWESTPIKVGMPLNGHWMSDLFAKHGRFDIHVEGDFTAFDSTVDGPIIEIIKAVRKRGYDYHKDRSAICDLIDISYDQVLSQQLGHTSTGNIFRKGTGETTGHSSTSMDNSMALTILYLAAWKELTGKNAREFLFFNELSCYGDDHLLSIANSRPRAWNPRNIKRVMSRWGVTNNLEVKPLAECEFLSKRCARVSNTLAAEMRVHGVALRTYAVWHNKAKLVGKLVAPVKNANPNYQVKRLLSYITLTAHHKDVYDGICTALESSWLKKALVASKLKVPSYTQVLRMWYNPSAQPFHPDPDPDSLLVNDGSLVQYGVPTLGDYVLAALSQVPDLLNPVVFNMGFSRAFQSQLAPLLVWVVDFIASTNGTPTSGMLNWALRGSVYSWLDTDVCVPGTSRSNWSSLLVRHWLFTSYCKWGPKFGTFRMGEFLVRRISNLQFLINGYVHRDFPRVDPALDKVLVAALLGLIVHVPDWFLLVKGVHLPEFSVIFDYAWNWVMSTIWMAVPSNYNELDPLFAVDFKAHSPLLITAPTGTGKSTGLIYHLACHAAICFQKVVVVEPRSLLAVGLRDYMTSTYGLDCTAGTLGEDFKESARVWYITPESLLARMHLVTKDFLFVLDEAHIEEDAYRLVKEILHSLPVGLVYTTATPTDKIMAKVKTVIDLPVASIWTVDSRIVNLNKVEYLSAWMQKARDLVANCHPRTRMAIIVDTPEMADSVATLANRECQVLSSKTSRTIDPRCQIFVCTNVIDVGVTIPDLHEIHFPGWEYHGAMGRFALSAQTSAQRRGRVGRTCNGLAFQYNPPVTLPTVDIPVRLSESSWKSLLQSGVPPSLVNHFDSHSLCSLLGFPQETTSREDWKDIVRCADVFISNLRPVFRANVASEAASGMLGRPATLTHTGMGRISGNWRQDNGLLFEDAVKSVTHVVNTSLGLQTSEEGKLALDGLSRVPGPILSVGPLATALMSSIKDGISKEWNHRNRNYTGTFEEVFEVPRILSLLQEISQLSEEV